jgi:GDP-L-fucose synthase
MNVIVTGASGFLGGHLCTHLEQDGHSVTKLSSKNCDLTDPSGLSRFEDMAYDMVYHLAAWTQAGDFCLHHQGEQWVINQLINTHVLRWWQQHQPQAKLIAMGSSCCYPDNLQRVEENFLRETPTETLLAYGMTKRMLYVGLDSIHKQYHLNYLLLVPSTLYGPNYHLDGRQSHFILDLIRKIVDAKHLGTPVELWGDGNQSRDIVYVLDFVKAAAVLAERAENRIVNISGGRAYSIRWYAEAISEIIGFDSKQILYDVKKYVGARNKLLETAKLTQLLPSFQTTDIHEGLKSTIDWYANVRGFCNT